MAINFPNNPAVNDTFLNGSDVWIWTGTGWDVRPVTSPSFNNVTTNGNLNVQGTITGSVIAGNVIPFYYPNQAAFPVASTVHGAIVHSHADGKMYFAHSGMWMQLQNADDNFVGMVEGMLMGNADTATALETARQINGVAFNGTQDITVTARADTLTGTTLHSTVHASSLTSVGTLTDLTVAGDVTAESNVVIGIKPSLPTHAANKRYVDGRSVAMSIALS